MQDQVANQANINSIIIAAVGVLLTGLIAWLIRSSTAKETRIKDLEKDIASLKTQAAVNEVKFTPIWQKVQEQLSKDLHHPHEKNAEMDQLLEKLEAVPLPTITKKETARLKELLEHRSTDMSPEIGATERASAQIMSVVMDKVLETTDVSAVELEVVSVPKTEGE